MNTIVIKRNYGTELWEAKHSGPTIVSLFGTDTLPTPYSIHTKPETVREHIQRLNRKSLVSIVI